MKTFYTMQAMLALAIVTAITGKLRLHTGTPEVTPCSCFWQRLCHALADTAEQGPPWHVLHDHDQQLGIRIMDHLQQTCRSALEFAEP
jgi:hypothetical protein